jgi:metallo-beta-lactamase class B
MAVFAVLPALSFAQAIPGVPSDTESMYLHLKKAREIAGPDLYPYYAHRCIIDQTYRRTLSRGVQAPGKIEAQKVFDNLYFVGANEVSAWAHDTGAGIVLFDAMNSSDDIRNVVEPGLRKYGLEPRNIKYLLITHAHGDHYGGAKYLRGTYGTRLLASGIDWDVMARTKTEPGSRWANLVPDRDLSVTDGQAMTIGKAVLHFYITPGHTPGTISTIFAATDNGAPHVVGFFGGMGTPGSAEDKKALIASADRFETLAAKAAVDVLIANHQTQDQAIPKLEELRLRHVGDPNPYVIGADRFRRFLEIQKECTLFAMAQQGQK